MLRNRKIQKCLNSVSKNIETQIIINMKSDDVHSIVPEFLPVYDELTFGIVSFRTKRKSFLNESHLEERTSDDDLFLSQ